MTFLQRMLPFAFLAVASPFVASGQTPQGLKTTQGSKTNTEKKSSATKYQQRVKWPNNI